MKENLGVCRLPAKTPKATGSVTVTILLLLQWPAGVINYVAALAPLVKW